MSDQARRHLATPDVGDRWLTAFEAADYLSVSVLTLSKWRGNGSGPRYSAALGRDPRYRMSDLVTFMDSKMVSNTIEARTARRGWTQHQPVTNYPVTARRRGR